MKKLLPSLIFLLTVSCAHQRVEQSANPLETPSTKSEKKAQAVAKTRAIFHVIAPLGIELVLFNMEDQSEERLMVDKTLSQIELKPGAWQVHGFVFNGHRYRLMNSSQQFIFNLKPDSVSYVGSYIFQCPKVDQSYLNELKKMNFFNRYPFTSDQRLCEMVVGSDFENVNRVWLQFGSSKTTPLILGF